MRASYRCIVGCTLLVAFLSGTLVYAQSIKVKQIPKRNRDNMTVLTIGSPGAGIFYSGKNSRGLTDLVSDPENKVFDIFCSAFDTERLRPSQNSSTPVVQRLRGSGSKPVRPSRRPYQLRPC
jgi:hypothetical protein